jgi:hypothetical protein
MDLDTWRHFSKASSEVRAMRAPVRELSNHGGGAHIQSKSEIPVGSVQGFDLLDPVPAPLFHHRDGDLPAIITKGIREVRETEIRMFQST